LKNTVAKKCSVVEVPSIYLQRFTDKVAIQFRLATNFWPIYGSTVCLYAREKSVAAGVTGL